MSSDDRPVIAKNVRPFRARANRHVIELVEAHKRKMRSMEGRSLPSTVKTRLEDGKLRPLSEIEADVVRLAIEDRNESLDEISRQLRVGRSTLYRKAANLGIRTRREAQR